MKIPNFVRPYLWSARIEELDLQKNKKRIVTNVLNLGSEKAAHWLLKTYSKKDIKSVVSTPLPGEWNKKSLYFWQFFFHLPHTKSKKRKVR